MPRLILSLAVLLSLAGVSHAASTETYEQMAKRARAGDASVDMMALRYAFAESPAYDPYGQRPEEAELAKAMQAEDCKAVLAASEKVLAVEFVDIRAHVWRASCFDEAKDTKKAAFHRTAGTRLIESIIASGDGLTQKTAWVVISVDEEYAVLAYLGIKHEMQSLVSGDEHQFDVMEGQTQDGKRTIYFFQIDRPSMALIKKLGGMKD